MPLRKVRHTCGGLPPTNPPVAGCKVRLAAFLGHFTRYDFVEYLSSAWTH